MGKYFGKVAYRTFEEVEPGIHEEVMTEREYRGEVIECRRRMISSTDLNDDIVINNKISIVSDPFAMNNFTSICYLEFMGDKWKVSDVEVQYPRLILSLGGLYNGK